MIPREMAECFRLRGDGIRCLASVYHSAYDSFMSRRNGTDVLERLLDPVSQSLNPEAARKLVRLKADVKTQARVDELARKCNEDELTPKERASTNSTSPP